MDILIIGLGSIGKRHLNNLEALGVNSISLVRRNKALFKNFNVYASINEAFKEQKSFTHIIIATPTGLHLDHFKQLISKDITNIYVEKPIAKNIDEGLQMLDLKAQFPNVNVYVGYDFRFDPGLQKVKTIINNNKLGKLISFQAEVGQFLPDWRPSEDYRKGMSASAGLGGGVMLDLIHEFDYIQWLFGPIKKIVGIHNKVSNLEIETEDISKVIFETSAGAIGTLSLDYIQKKLARNCKIVFENGVINWDYVTSKVSWFFNHENQWQNFDYGSFQRNDRFLEIMTAFISDDTSKKEQLVTLEEGFNSLKLVELAKKSNKTQKIITI